MHLPLGGEEFLDGVSGEEVRRAVRAIEHADVPGGAVAGDQARVCRLRRGDRRGRGAGRQLGLGDGQHVGGTQGAPGMPAELAKGEGGAAAQVQRHIQAIAYGQVGAAAAERSAQLEHLAGLDLDWLPVGHRRIVQGGRAVGAGQGDQCVAVKAQGRALQSKFQTGGFGGVTDNAVGQAEGEIVHRPGRRHADIPVTEATRIVLHAGVGARLQHFDDAGLEGEAVEQARPHLALGETLVGHHLAQVVEVAGDAVQAGFAQGFLQLGDGFVTSSRVDDQLGDHRVVEGRNLAAGADPAVDAHVVREVHVGEHARAGLEVLQRVFGVDPHLDGGALRGAVERGPVQRIACGHAQHALDHIQAGDHLGDRVLDLQAGVHFEEVEVVAGGVVYEFHGAGAAVFNRLAQLHGCGVQAFAGGLRQVRRRGFLDHLLVAPLQRAVALAEGGDAALAVAENLYLDVARLIDETLEEHPGIAEKLLAHALDAVVGACQCGGVAATGQADAATACGGLEHHRVADAVGGAQRFFQALQQAGARRHRHLGLGGQFTCSVFEAELANLLASRADEGDAGCFTGIGELGAFREKAITGVDRLGAGFLRSGENLVDT